MQVTALHILDNTFAPDPRVLKEIKTLQNKLKIKVILVCIYADKPESVIEDGIDIRRILPESIKTYYKTDLSAVIQKVCEVIEGEGITALHAHDHISLNLAVEIKKKFPKLGLIYDAHEYIRGWYTYETEKKASIRFKGNIVHKIFSYYEKKNIKEADVLITVSQGLEKLYQKLRYQKPIFVLRNVSYRPSRTNQTDIRKELKLSEEDLIVLHSGGIYYKDDALNYFLRNISLADKKVKLVFLCNENGKAKIENAETFELIKDRTYFHDFVPYQELSGFISTADVGILLNYKPDWPSHWHSLPNRIFDYSNAGLAILSTSQPEFVSFIEKYDNGLFFDLNISDDLSKKLEAMFPNMGKYKNNSKNSIEDNIWESEEHVLLSAYKTILD